MKSLVNAQSAYTNTNGKKKKNAFNQIQTLIKCNCAIWWVRRVNSANCDLHKIVARSFQIKWKQFVDVKTKQSKANRSKETTESKRFMQQKSMCDKRQMTVVTDWPYSHHTAMIFIVHRSFADLSHSISHFPSLSVCRSLRCKYAQIGTISGRLNYRNDFRQINCYAQNNQQINALPINHSRLLFVYFTFDFDFMWCMPKW